MIGGASALHKIKKHKDEWNSWSKVGKLIPMMIFYIIMKAKEKREIKEEE